MSYSFDFHLLSGHPLSSTPQYILIPVGIGLLLISYVCIVAEKPTGTPFSFDIFFLICNFPYWESNNI